MDPSESLRKLIRDVPDFPKRGVVFKDITPLLLDPDALRLAGRLLVDRFRGDGIDVVAGIEARGFIIGTLAAQELNVGLAILRKGGKLPYKTIVETYELEYGVDSVEMHVDALRPGQRVLVIDDLLATGGTASAACRLIEKLEGKVAGCGFVIELSFLNGRDRLTDYKVVSLIDYQSE